jgi:plasmid stabilization system protein ParE
VKYLEGRSAALREFRRHLGDTSGPEAHHEVEQRWRDHPRLALDRNMGPDWVAYRTGGIRERRADGVRRVDAEYLYVFRVMVPMSFLTDPSVKYWKP